MTKPAYTATELVGLPGMPAKSTRSIYLFEGRRGLVSVPGSKPKAWTFESLPVETQAALAASDEAEPAPDVPPTLRAGNGADEATADARLDILSAFDRWRAGAGTTVMLDDMREFCGLYRAGEIAVAPETRDRISQVGRTALDRWYRLRRDGGWTALVPRRSRVNIAAAKIDADEDLRDFIIAHILERPNHVNCRHIMRAARARFDAGRLPSERSLRRFVSKWRAENARTISAVADPDRHRSKYLPAGGDAAAGVDRLNQVWELDSTPADVLCTDGRHAIVGAIDVWSRRMKVIVTPTSKATAIAGLLRRSIMDWGVPEGVRTDEGSDYTSRHLRRVLADLDVAHDILPPYSPQKKPFIERGLGTLSKMLELLPGFAGHSVAEAQSLRARKSFAARRGEGDAEAFSVAMSSGELQETVDAWLETVYGREPHAGLAGRSPFEVAASWSRPIRRIENERALDLLLAEPADGGGWRTVQKKGIRTEGGTFIAPELGALVGERVQVRLDPADAGLVYVFDSDGAFLCSAVAPEREGVDRSAVAAAMKARARAADAEGRDLARGLRRDYRPQDAIQDILAAGRTDAERVIAFPGPAEAHESDGLAAAAEAAVSGRRRPAPLTPDQEAAAEAQLERFRSGAAAGAQSGQGPADGRPQFESDVDFCLWVEAHPTEATDDDRAYADELQTGSATLRQLIEMERERARATG